MKFDLELFHKGRDLVVAQGQPSTQYGDCRYRGANDTKCFAGFFIPDEEYVKREEGPLRSYGHLFTPEGFVAVKLGQTCHDHAAIPLSWDRFVESICLVMDMDIPQAWLKSPSADTTQMDFVELFQLYCDFVEKEVVNDE